MKMLSAIEVITNYPKHASSSGNMPVYQQGAVGIYAFCIQPVLLFQQLFVALCNSCIERGLKRPRHVVTAGAFMARRVPL